MTCRMLESVLVAFVLDVLANGVPTRSAGSCPSFCVCDTWYELHRVSCIGRHLYSIHTSAPSDVQAMDVSRNSISELNDYELANIGLSKLKYFNLSVNAISDIGLHAFDGLSELAVLDLSQNHLHYLLPETFLPAKSLQILRLSKNNFNSHVPKLQSSSIMNLALDSCQISHIPVDTFIGLSHLHTLDLSNNLMIQLDSVVLQPLKLRQLSTEGNPWSCNKLMHDLELYLINSNVEYRAVCAKIPGPKKFEKMILYDPQKKYEKHRPSIIANVNIKKGTLTPEKNLTPTPTVKNATICVNNATEDSNFTRMLNAISPYWFFTFGFVFGSACGMFTCYIWLTRSITCCRRYRERRTNDIQRVSLLQNVWQFDDSAFNDSRHGTISCPGTPPPPYREVMLRPGLYRSPSVTATNNNAATNSTERI